MNLLESHLENSLTMVEQELEQGQGVGDSDSDLIQTPLKLIEDTALIRQTKRLVRQESELLTKVLHHLREIDRRRLFSSLGRKSLHEFAVKDLGYPDDQAYRRISAMKLLDELPQIEGLISRGEISLTHMGLAQTLFRQEEKIHQKKMNGEEKVLVLQKIAHLSVRDAEKVTLSLSSAPVAAKPDRVKLVTEELVEMKFLASTEIQEKIETLKGRLAHQHPNLSLGELFEKLCDWRLERLDPSAPRRRVKAKSKTASKSKASDKTKSKAATEFKAETENQTRAEAEEQSQIQAKAQAETQTETQTKVQIQNQTKSESSKKPAAPRKRGVEKIPAATRRLVFQKARNQCENCGSCHALEVDHIRPQALGGNSELENLRLLCRSCNQRAAIRNLGMEKMRDYLENQTSFAEA